MKDVALILIAILALLLLVGCKAVDPSTAIIKTAQTNAQAISSTVKRIEATTSKECLTDALVANLAGIKNQIATFNGQLESVDTACKVEKSVLKEKITVRDSVICFLALLFLCMVYLKIKGSR